MLRLRLHSLRPWSYNIAVSAVVSARKPDRQMGLFHAIEPAQHGDFLLLALSLALAWSLLRPEHVLELRHLRRPVDKLAHPW